METIQISDLLRPFLGGPVSEAPRVELGNRSHNETIGAASGLSLSDSQLNLISDYLDLLLKWNSRINLTSVREPEEIIQRHFGESIFAARHLIPALDDKSMRVIDVGSGAGFPGVPIKICAPQVSLALIESNQKKSTFLRELVRTLKLEMVKIFADRAEKYPNQGELVTFRAVEDFNSTLESTVSLITPRGRIALMIGESQLARARKIASGIEWAPPVPIPLSTNRILLIGNQNRQESH